ncbi:MAG: hypothetical protein HYU66_08870 [Armatimonadetes bacterium]|nr:hypothetical protein [Armatimonadota bacterium]
MRLQYDPAREGWDFETDELRGFLLPTGQRHGVKTLVHKPTGLEVVHPSYDVLNMFLLFSTNLCMGQARTLERTSEREGNSVMVRFRPSAEFRAELTARYTFVEPNAIDLTIHLKSDWVYPAFELFLSNYYPPGWQPHAYVQGCEYSPHGGADEWIAPVANDVFLGTGLVFPRDQHVSPRSVDGRWNRIWALYQWNPQRYYARPLVSQTDPDRRVQALLMARPDDCFATVTGYSSTNMDDPFVSQNPLYLCLFGVDLLPGTERTVTARLAVVAGDEDWLRVYDGFVAG